MSIKTAILTLKEAKPRRRRAPDYSHIDPQDMTEDGVPYDNYESPCLEPHPFDGRRGDY